MYLDHRLLKGKIISSRIYPQFFPINPTQEVVNFGCGVGPQAVVYRNMYKRMVGIDLNRERLEASHVMLRDYGVTNYETLVSPVEGTPFLSSQFDKALAIDIIEHLKRPELFLAEAHRVLKPGGELLLSIPAMHDHYVHLFRRIGRLLGRKTQSLPQGHLDAHNSHLSLKRWEDMIALSPFTIVRTRASTLWPPLHLYGLPRFWFTNSIVHAVDNFLCQLPILKRWGQAYLFVLRKSA